MLRRKVLRCMPNFPAALKLIPILISQNHNDEGLLKHPHCFRVWSPAAVHLQHDALKLFPQRGPFWAEIS
jgi:hypothetical protein